MTKEEAMAIIDKVVKELEQREQPRIEDHTWSKENLDRYRKELANINSNGALDEKFPSHHYFFVSPNYTLKAGNFFCSLWTSYARGGSRMLPANWLQKLLEYNDGKPLFRVTVMRETSPHSGEFEPFTRDLLAEILKQKDKAFLATLYKYIDFTRFPEHREAAAKLLNRP